MPEQSQQYGGSLKSFAAILRPPKIQIERKHLSRYSWLPDVLRVEGSIIRPITGPVLTVTIFALIIAYLHDKDPRINLTNNVVPLLSVVVGLILVFRNGSSYDRWHEGRKDWGTMTSSIRTLSRLIWINVNLPPDALNPSSLYWQSLPARIRSNVPAQNLQSSSLSQFDIASAQNLAVTNHLRQQKIRVVKLCIAYAVAVKHLLQNEEGAEYEDFVGLLPLDFARFDATGRERSFATSPERSYSYSSVTVSPADQLRDNRSIVDLPSASTPLLNDRHRTVQFFPYSQNKRHMPLPLIIAHEISRTLFRFKRLGCLEITGPTSLNGMQLIIQQLVEMLTAMERVGNTPIPISYSIHLKQCVSLYLFTLPFTLVNDLKWTMIPVVTVVAFTLMGIEGIADEIENPFENDASVLPLEDFCIKLRSEVEYMMERLPEGIDEMDINIEELCSD